MNKEITDRSRKKHLSTERKALCYVLNERGYSNTEIAELIKRHRTNVYYLINSATDLIFVKDKEFIEEVERQRNGNRDIFKAAK